MSSGDDAFTSRSAAAHNLLQTKASSSSRKSTSDGSLKMQHRAKTLWQKVRNSFDDGKLKKSAATTTLATARVPNVRLGGGMRVPDGSDITASLRRVYQSGSDVYSFYFSAETISSQHFADTISVLFWLIVVDNFRQSAGIEYLAALFANFSFFFGVLAINYEREFKIEVSMGSTPSAAAHSSGRGSKNDWRSAFCELASQTLQLMLEQSFPIEHDKVCAAAFLRKMKSDLQVWVIGIPISQFTGVDAGGTQTKGGGGDEDVDNTAAAAVSKAAPSGRVNRGLIREDGTFSLHEANIAFVAQLSHTDGTTRSIRRRPISAHQLSAAPKQQQQSPLPRPTSRPPTAAGNSSGQHLVASSSGGGRLLVDGSATDSGSAPLKKLSELHHHPAQGQSHESLLRQTVDAVANTTFGFIATEEAALHVCAGGGGGSADAVRTAEAQLAEEVRLSKEGGPRREAFSTRHNAIQQQVNPEKMIFETAIAKIQFEAMVAAERQRREKIAMIGKPVFADSAPKRAKGGSTGSLFGGGSGKLSAEANRFVQLQDHEYVPNRAQITEKFGLDMSSPVMRIFLSFTVATMRDAGLLKISDGMSKERSASRRASASRAASVASSSAAVTIPTSSQTPRNLTSITRRESPIRAERLLDPKRSALLREDERDDGRQSNDNTVRHSGVSVSSASHLGTPMSLGFAANERSFIDYIAKLFHERTAARVTKERFRIRCPNGHDAIAVCPNLFLKPAASGDEVEGQRNGNNATAVSTFGEANAHEHLVVNSENLDYFLAGNENVHSSRRDYEKIQRERERRRLSDSASLHIPPLCSLCNCNGAVYFCAVCRVSMCKVCRPPVGTTSGALSATAPTTSVSEIPPELIFGDALSKQTFAPEVRVDFVETRCKVIADRLMEMSCSSRSTSSEPPEAAVSRRSISPHVNEGNSTTHSLPNSAAASRLRNMINSNKRPASAHPKLMGRAASERNETFLGDFMSKNEATKKTAIAPPAARLLRPQSAAVRTGLADNKQDRKRPMSAKVAWNVGTRELITGEEIPLSRHIQTTSLQNRPIRETLNESHMAPLDVSKEVQGKTVSSSDVVGPNLHSSVLQVIRNRAINESLKETQRIRSQSALATSFRPSSASRESAPIASNHHSHDADLNDSPFISSSSQQANCGGTHSASAAAHGILSNFASGGTAHKIAHGIKSTSIRWSPADVNTVTSFQRIRDDISRRTQTSLSHVAEIKRSEMEAKQKSLQNEKNTFIAESRNFVEGIQRTRELERQLKRNQQKTTVSALTTATEIMEERHQRFNEAPPSNERRHAFNALLLSDLNKQKQNIITLRDIMFDLPVSTHQLVHKFVCQRRLYISELVTAFKANNHDTQSIWPPNLADHYTMCTPEEVALFTASPLAAPSSAASSVLGNVSDVDGTSKRQSFAISLDRVLEGIATETQIVSDHSAAAREADAEKYGSTPSQPQPSSKLITRNKIDRNKPQRAAVDLPRPRQVEAVMIPSTAGRKDAAKEKHWGDLREMIFSVEQTATERKISASVLSEKTEEERESERRERTHAAETFGKLSSDAGHNPFEASHRPTVRVLSEEELAKERAEHIRNIAGVKKTAVGKNIVCVGGQMLWEDTGNQIGSSASTFLLTRRKNPLM